MPARFVRSLALALLFAAPTAPAAQARGWERLGSRTVEPKAELERIIVTPPQRYASIRLCAGRRAVRVYDLDVRMANGRRYDVRAHNMVPAGACSRALGLPTRRSALVALTVRSQAAGPGRGNTSLRIYAR
jgi:hypothetical protein